MTEDFVITLGRQALLTVLMVAGPILLMGLIAGLSVAIFQATTQINEQTLSFIPKIMVVLGGIVLFGPWMHATMIGFAQSIFALIPGVVP